MDKKTIVNGVKGYKVFNSDWTCNPDGKPFQYEVGKTFEEDVDLKRCKRGLHFCKRAQDCFNYYGFDPSNKVAEVLALGEIIEDGVKCCTNKLKIVREISWQEVLALVNTGVSCTGRNNSGNCNSGDCNSGNCNSGDYNSGDYNSGNRNSGDYNSGNCNSGDYNSGDYNSGDYNKSSHVAGCFNVEQHRLLFFDKPSDMTLEQWRNSEARDILEKVDLRPTVWVCSANMSDEEKEQHPEYSTIGGYLRKQDTSKSFIKWWAELSVEEKTVIKNIPNFDGEKFFLITGVRV